MAEQAITFETRGRIAIITLNLPKKLNALTQDLYYRIATLMHEIAERDDIKITILTGNGRFFSAGADVTISREAPDDGDAKRHFLKSFVSNNLNITHAFYTHPKILIAALNGPAIGLSAALVAYADFIYAAPHTFLLTPFSSLGLVAEGGASTAFVQRLGISKANEALIMSKRLTIEELVHTGFVNKVINTKPGDTDAFMKEVLHEVDERLGTHLNQDSLLKIKALIRRPKKDENDSQLIQEVVGGLERFVAGVPQEEFRKIASGEKKHKL
ncbi:peroxisomal d3,d2-enoyl-CoA isomerase [Myriangium duriaei CBS 260.36]|uniref:Peroxisomal d3,d2-enoyl-CoA isomerase n=1 Tax=Myriangium duriaei CBS 260.36 TaxID=1168546 RepID=A0A9P4MEX7_9PEZI|nr:peroxisomal d3,d2-enoyl-CoA isomerase [Myriangium duriaei CBS 260.36]